MALLVELLLIVIGVIGSLISEEYKSIGIALAILGGIGAIFTSIKNNRDKRKADLLKEEIKIEKLPHHWSVFANDYRKTCLRVTPREHKRGKHVMARIEYLGWKRPEMVISYADGIITVKYQENNYPLDPRMSLNIYVKAV